MDFGGGVVVGGDKANKVNQTEENTSNGGSWQKSWSTSTVEIFMI